MDEVRLNSGPASPRSVRCSASRTSCAPVGRYETVSPVSQTAETPARRYRPRCCEIRIAAKFHDQSDIAEYMSRKYRAVATGIPDTPALDRAVVDRVLSGRRSAVGKRRKSSARRWPGATRRRWRAGSVRSSPRLSEDVTAARKVKNQFDAATRKAGVAVPKTQPFISNERLEALVPALRELYDEVGLTPEFYDAVGLASETLKLTPTVKRKAMAQALGRTRRQVCAAGRSTQRQVAPNQGRGSGDRTTPNPGEPYRNSSAWKPRNRWAWR